jgi:WD40 repeat protein
MWPIPERVPHRSELCFRRVAITPDGRRVVSASRDRTLRVWDLESGQRVRTLEGHTGYVMAVAITPDGRRAVSASSDQTLRLWDLESGQSLHPLEGHTGEVSGVAITPDGRRAVSASVDKTLRVWDWRAAKACAHSRATVVHCTMEWQLRRMDAVRSGHLVNKRY